MNHLLRTGWLLLALLLGAGGAARGQPAGYHRYRGTVGGQAVTVELTFGLAGNWPYTPTCTGTLRLAGQPTVLRYLRAWPAYRPGRPLRLVEADSAQPAWLLADWQVASPVGAVLTGTRTTAAGRRAAFRLRESYLDDAGQVAAAPCEVVHYALVRAGGEVLTGPQWAARHRAGHGPPPPAPAALLDRDYLHLRGPDTLRPALARLQGPAPARRQAQARARLDGFSDGTEESLALQVSYNAYGLLSWQEFQTHYAQGAVHPNHGISSALYSLPDSTLLTLDDLLQPGAGWALGALLARHVLAWSPASAPALRDPAGRLWVEPPAGGVALTENGLRFSYSDNELLGFGSIQPDLEVPWMELLPLLRPDTPVARMLRERGLWRPARP